MTAHSKETALQRVVVDLIGLEGKLERTLGARATGSGADAEFSEALQRFAGMAAGHRAALQAYLTSIGDGAAAQLLREKSPRYPGTQDEDDAAEYGAIGDAGAATLGLRRLTRQQRLDRFPEIVG